MIAFLARLLNPTPDQIREEQRQAAEIGLLHAQATAEWAQAEIIRHTSCLNRLKGPAP